MPVAAGTIPPADAGLALLLEASGADGYLWPVARNDLRDILAHQARLKAAITDTSSLIIASYQDSLAARSAVEAQLRHDLRWLELDLQHAHENRLRWWQHPAVVVPVSVLVTVWALDVVID